MATITIDGRRVEVPEGATILDGARRLGIRVPALCEVTGREPYASCFLCVVAVEGRDDLVPACAAPASDGLVVTTDSEDIREARRTALELLLSDHAGDCEGPCTVGCPAGADIPEMIRLIASGRRDEAARVIRDRIPFAASLGRICHRFCERVCRRAELDSAVNICELKRYAGEAALEAGFLEEPGEATGRSVAVVGAGPAGLSAVHRLRMIGHAVTVFEAEDEPGGAFRHALPEFRLPAAAIAAEVESILRLGPELKTGVRLGTDVSLAELRRDFDAVFIATGAPVAETPGLPGAEHATAALDFLRAVRRGEPPDAGAGAVVIGGDGCAVDAALAARRMGLPDVTLVCEAPRARMGAPEERVAAAEADGVRVECGASGLRIEPAAGRGLAVIRAGRGPVTASLVLIAGHRRADTELARSEGLEVTHLGIRVDRRTLATGADGVFAGGEAATGAGAGVRAVAAGRLAAVSIDQYLRGEAVTGEARAFNSRLGRLTDDERAAVFAGSSPAGRASGAGGGGGAGGAGGAGEAPAVFSEADAGREAGRCLECDCVKRSDCRLRDLATEYGARQGRFRGERRAFSRDETHDAIVYEAGKCILCGICVRVAAEAGEARGITFLRRGFTVRMGGAFEDSIAEALRAAPERCAEACPTGAIALRRGSSDGRAGLKSGS